MDNNPEFRSLRETLTQWEDADIAAYKLGCALGVLPPEDGSYNGFQAVKHLFWGANSLGETLSGFLDELVRCNVLQYDEDNVKFRWNPDFTLPS